MFHVSPDLFYGSPGSRNLETPRKIDPRIFLKHRQTPLLSESRTWKVFERQDEALAFAKSRPDNGLMTFVFHATGTGHRLFLVAHPREFWLHDLEKEKSARCSYEIIPEFVPCKLYLDLEFETEFNPTLDGVKLTELFIKIVAYRLHHLYHLRVDRTMILDLDSSTPKKFSRHLIYQIPLLCFASNYEVGLLVKDISCLILQSDENLCASLEITPEELKQLVVKDRHGKDKLFCDEGVYSKNRHFRLFGSTKPHKNSHLEVSQENQFTVCFTDPKAREEAMFLASLVTNFEPFDIIAPLPEREDVRIVNKRIGHGSTGDAKNLPSLYPILDSFVLQEMQREGVRSWIYFSSTQCLLYESYRPAFCGNVGREHRSNKGMLIVDLRHHHYYRKCYDHDCSGYQSEPKQLPSYVVTSLQHPECTEEERKEIKELLEFLESEHAPDDSLQLVSQSSLSDEVGNMSLDASFISTNSQDRTPVKNEAGNMSLDASFISTNSQDTTPVKNDVCNMSLDASFISTNSQDTPVNEVYEKEVQDILEFLESQPEQLDF